MLGGPMFTTLSPGAPIPSLATHIPNALVAPKTFRFQHTIGNLTFIIRRNPMD